MSTNFLPIVVAARRTPIGTRGRALSHLDVTQLVSPVICAALEDARAVGMTQAIADVILGNCMGPGGNPGRLAALASGLGTTVPGGTVDRQCGSGLAAIIDAATALRLDGRPRVAGGTESASTAPTRLLNDIPYSRAPFAPSGFADPDMLAAADDLALLDGIDRQRQDDHAERSHHLASIAAAAGVFDAELVPLAGLSLDDSIQRSGGVVRRMVPLRPGGTVTGGNSSRISDGAAAVVLAPAGTAPGLAIRATAFIGVDPALPGIGAAPAVMRVLADYGVEQNQVAAFEIVEAFAAQSLAVLDRLGVDAADPRVCADGGAIALGHPWGASGAVSVVRLFSRLVRQGAPAGTLGVAAASVGGGLGVAALFEVVR